MRYEFCARCPQHVMEYTHNKAGVLSGVIDTCKHQKNNRWRGCSFQEYPDTKNDVVLVEYRHEGTNTYLSIEWVSKNENRAVNRQMPRLLVGQSPAGK